MTIICPKNYKKSLLCGLISQTPAEMPPKNGGVRKANCSLTANYFWKPAKKVKCTGMKHAFILLASLLDWIIVEESCTWKLWSGNLCTFIRPNREQLYNAKNATTGNWQELGHAVASCQGPG
jgi:hypothetical protein